ncbi:hypothetical protein [Ruminococcus sp. AM31-15AC]|uniref:hypothetical protein n=1 Tax=Ruminococcus sp. AM31-15AC TaxID=2293202 RepID=UPI000E4A5103|nr:hypothetical protein DW793_13890 [Ruminococcus sp. AM31-15AC]
MGREVVFANIRKRMIAMIAGGVILTLMGGFISFAAVVAGEYGVLILGLFALTPGVIFLIFGTSRRTHPEKSGIFKANPDLLQQLTSFTPTYNIRTIILSYPTGCLPTRKHHSDVLARGSLRHLPAHSEYEFHQLHQRDNRLHETQEECTAF